MSGAVGAVALDLPAPATDSVVGVLALVRIAAENGATRADLLRDLAPIASHRLSPSELRKGIESALISLLAVGAVDERRGRFRLTEAGVDLVADRLGKRKLPPTFAEIRDIRLIAHALELPAEPMVLKSLERPDGLRSLILQKFWNVGGKRTFSASRLRMALAVVALERAFGNKIKSSLEAGRGLSVKASRLLAGQLAQRPRDFGTDTRLITGLAAEAVGATQSDPNSLRQAILRQYVSEQLGGMPSPAVAPELVEASEVPQVALAEVGRAANDVEPAVSNKPAAANRPDLEGFAREVLRCADAAAEGWPGNRKALIAPVWRALANAHPEWGINDIEFKGMLAEAHRTGHVVLGSADIKSKENLKDVQDSAIAYKNTVWHFIRVEN